MSTKKGFLRRVFYFLFRSETQNATRVRTGTAFAVIVSFVALVLTFSGVFAGADDYLTTLIFQIGYSAPETFQNVLVVKKDQKTSEILNINPGRGEFASMFEFLGSTQVAKRPSAGAARKFVFMSMSFGLLDNHRGPIINSFFDKWFEHDSVESSLFAYKDLFLSGVGRHPSGKLVYGRGPNLFKNISGSMRKDAIFETMALDYSGDVEAESEDYYQVMNYWYNIIMNLLTAEIKPRLVISPDTGTAKFEVAIITQGVPAEYQVEPSAVVAFDFVLQGAKNAEVDAQLTHAIENADSALVLAAMTIFEDEVVQDLQEDESKSAPTSAKDMHETVRVRSVGRVIKPHDLFVKDNVRLAMINMSVGNKGFVTQAPLFVLNEVDEKLEPSFALMIAMLALDAQDPNPEDGETYEQAMYKELARIYPEYVAKKFDGIFRAKDIEVPVNSMGRIYIDYVGSTTRPSGKNTKMKYPAFHSVSMYEALNEGKLREYLAQRPDRKGLDPKNAHRNILNFNKNKGGKIVLVGPFEASDFDFYPTPMNQNSPYRIQQHDLMGVEIHVNALINILEGRALRHPNMRTASIILILTSIILGIMLQYVSPLHGFFLSFVFMGAISWNAYYSYHVGRQVFYFAALLFAYLSIWILSTLSSYLHQRAKAASTRQMFSRFVAADVVEYMLSNPDLVKPGGEKVELTIFFSDVAGFTSISEALSPEELVVLLNEYLGAMTDLLFEYGGTLDKFIGDAVMAFWNFPQKQEDHAARACLCALAMQKKILELQKGWAERGLPKVSARAGLNSAQVVVGYMGSSKAQMNFTCMGDGVNLAARLEGANKEYETDLMIGEATYQQVKNLVTTRFLDYLTVKGKVEPVRVHELVCEKGKEPPHWAELSKMYDHAIKLHLERKWDEAIETFEDILSRWPDDGPSKTYLHRCHAYRESPPPEGWDGRYILTRK